MNFENYLVSESPGIPLRSAEAVLKLVSDGATVPFIARYRKEHTGNLDEVAVQAVIDLHEKWDQLVKRQSFIIEEIERQGKMTPELKTKILASFQSVELEDLYLPYKVKRKTKAALAREAGLEPLAEWIWGVGHGTETPQPGQTLDLWAFTFRNEEKGFKDSATAIEGALDILIERLSENTELRQKVRNSLFKQGQVLSIKSEKSKPNSKYENYFAHQESIESLLKPENSHRYLAIRRGWIEEELILLLGGGTAHPDLEIELIRSFEGFACTHLETEVSGYLLKAARTAYKVHVLNSIENEIHKSLREIADQAAIKVFAENLKKLLLASPFGPKSVLGIDPGLRTGCKLAVVDETGKFIANTVIFLQTPEQKSKAVELLTGILSTGLIQAIAIGNGTAGRETETFVRATLREKSLNVPVVMVSEAGASVYSASEIAREEFPDLDLTIRGAISIARRLQDPLSELVKVDPKAIGVGQYQHDVSQSALKRNLELVVDSCVNSVGINLNTSSAYLLARVAGIGEGLAKAIVDFRNKHGLFKSRKILLEVPRFSTKTFEQAAGFLRVPESDNPLDNTGVHPEQYGVIEEQAQKLGKSVKDLLGEGATTLKDNTDFKEQVGKFTFQDIIRDLEKPGLDPREEFVPFAFREDIMGIKDLKPGMICPGIVTNVTNFGAFVDIGVHQDGLVHISQISDQFIKEPREAVSPGDRVTIRVLEANLEKNQISLSMKLTEEPKAPKRAPREARAPKSPPKRAPLVPSGEPPKVKPRPQGEPPPRQPVAAKRPAGPKQTIAPKAAFNNPFAALSNLKNALKPTGK